MDRYEEKDSICICEKEDFLAGLYEYKIHLSAGVSLNKRGKKNYLFFLLKHFAYIWSHMSIQGEANEFLNLLFGEINEKRFAQVIKVK
jgi:hypothetical protein